MAKDTSDKKTIDMFTGKSQDQPKKKPLVGKKKGSNKAPKSVDRLSTLD